MSSKKRNHVSARKVLNQIKWDPKYDIDEFQVTYIHRGTPTNTRTVHVTSLEVHPQVFTIEETDIPYHRIIEIRNRITDEILFSRRPPKTSGV